jgi:hypothetical protein
VCSSDLLVISSADSFTRIAATRAEAVRNLDPSATRDSLERVVRPRSLSRGMKAAGIALFAVPDPITDIPAAALVASSFLLKRSDPAGLIHLRREAAGLLRDLRSFTL